jgi:hypothetical protein
MLTIALYRTIGARYEFPLHHTSRMDRREPGAVALLYSLGDVVNVINVVRFLR